MKISSERTRITTIFKNKLTRWKGGKRERERRDKERVRMQKGKLGQKGRERKRREAARELGVDSTYRSYYL